MNLKDLLQIAGQQGKVVVVGEDGEVKGVFLNFEEYQKLGISTADKAAIENEAEKINREILQAQLEEVMMPAAPEAPAPESLNALLSRRAEQLFKSVPADYPADDPVADFPAVPNYKYNPPTVTSSDEEIKPNFDDI